MSVSAVGDRSVQPQTAIQSSVATTAESWFSWTGAIALLVFVIWVVPIKSYTLPIKLPFSLELYRLLLLLFVVSWIGAVVVGKQSIRAGGLGKPLGMLGAVAVLALLTNLNTISALRLQTQALKSLSYFLSFLLVYVLVTSTVRDVRAVERIIRVFVAGAVLVALAAVYESRTHYNVFQHLHQWIPLFHPTHIFGDGRLRGGRLRVMGPAQHPIALGAALTMAAPLAVYLASRARTRARSLGWWAATLVVMAGAVATVSRTVLLMSIAMLLTGLVVRRRELLRRWPVLIVILLAAHVASPGAASHIYRAFFPKQGLSGTLQARSGGVGSGRLADIGPGLRSWQEAPFFGHGLGTGVDPGTVGTGAIVDPQTGAPIIFDDQYMNSLVLIGALGLVAVIWFVWGAGVKLVRTARERTGADGDLIAACAATVVAFAAGMITFDAFSFVQCTLIFFVVAALGLRVRSLAT